MKRMQKTNPNSVIRHTFEHSNGFISVNGTFAYFSLLYKAFTGDTDFSRKLALSSEPADNFTYRCVDGTTTPPDLSTISQFTVLYGSYGEPVANKLESNMTEAGLAACVISDFRDECHGRFLSLSNFIQSPRHPQTDFALVLLVTPREESLCRNFLDRLPGHLPIVLIRTEIASPLASIDLLYKMSVFTSVFGEQYRGSNPNDPENLGGLQKGAFRDLVSFQDDFRMFGSLRLIMTAVPYTDRLSMESKRPSVDILGLHFSDVDVPYLMAAFNDTRDAQKTQQTILNPEKGYLNNPQRIRRDFLEDRFHAKCRRALEFEKPDCPWCVEWKKFLLGEPADADILNNAYINWLGSTLRFTRQNDGTLQVETVSPTTPDALPTHGLIGGIVGEVLGSKYELEKDKQKVKALAGKPHLKPSVSMTYTDDTVLSLAIAKWLVDDPTHDKQTLIDLFKRFARRYASYSFGKDFQKWVKSDSRAPYGGHTNGSAMRVAPVAWYAQSLDECLALAKATAEITHNSDEGIRGAQAVAAAIFLNRTGHSKSDIKSYIEQTFGYNLNRTTDEIRPVYAFETACDKSVPESIICFLESESFEDAVIRAISLGGDTDTMGCMAGNIAAASMPVPSDLATFAYEKLPLELREILVRWNAILYL
jgi:ADP-ribosylglycohydrolase